MAVDPDWTVEFARWVAPFLDALGNRKRRLWAPFYLRGLLLPGERKSIEPMAARVAPGHKEELHHFIAVAEWDAAALEAVLVDKANRLVGGEDAVLVVDDTALPKKGRLSVGVAHQHCGELGKQANCQALVSLTLARGEVPICLALRLYLPQEWVADRQRRKRCGVPRDIAFRTKPQIALDEIDRVIARGARFGDVLADAGYGTSADFRRGLSERGLTWAVGIVGTQRVYPAEVTLAAPERRLTGGRPRSRPVPSALPVQARHVLADLPWKRITWRRGTKGPLRAHFCAARVRVADVGPRDRRGRPLPGDEEVWLIGERRAGGETKYHLSNRPAATALRTLASLLKARWVCEQPHQQMKEELGVGHHEGRSWQGLHHHALMTMISFAFLQHLRLGGRRKRSHEGRGPLSAAGEDSRPRPQRVEGGPRPWPRHRNPL
jgi:SRSO17 transposase